VDLTTVATPMYFGTMAVEHKLLERRAARRGRPSPADYEKPDTLASLSMGVLSLVTPLVAQRLVRAFAPRARAGKVLLATTVAAAAATTVADRVARRAATPPGDVSAPSRSARRARAVARVGGVATVAGAAVLASAAVPHYTSSRRLWRRGRRRDLGTGPVAWAAAIVGWDFVYYWNHRFMHEVRLQWAHHVVHHSSERFNLSTALRQPVTPIGVWFPYGVLAWAGVRPALIEHARGINLLYQYWIHTDTIDSLGPGEEVLNSPSHHRVHHGSNRRYIDRNHGSFLIVWDRLFGTFAREDRDDPVVYGLTRNIESFHPVRIVTHEYADMVRDVAGSDNWVDRVSFVVRGPGWAYRRRAERGTPEPLVTS
jgi:sterol desaturase/sphingolipid hydroxylase (fatty acid hydroxylase superfamily)